MPEPARREQDEQRQVAEDGQAVSADRRSATAEQTAGSSDPANHFDPGHDTPAPATEPERYILKLVDGGEAPAIDGDELRRLAVQGRITPQTPVRLVDSPDWQTAAEHVDGLDEVSGGSASPAPRPPAEKRFYMDRKPWIGVVIVLVFFVAMFLWKLFFGSA